MTENDVAKSLLIVKNEKEEEKIIDEVLRKYAEYYEASLYDLGAFELVLASCLSMLTVGKKDVWLYVVAPSGSNKTEIADILEGWKNHTVSLNDFTPKMLKSTKIVKINGHKTEIGKHIISQINGKIWLIRDFTTTISKCEDERTETYGVLRILYDGKMQFGSGNTPNLNDDPCRTLIIACVTPSIDRQGRNMQLLGERFLKVRLAPNAEKASDKASRNMMVNNAYLFEMQNLVEVLFEGIIGIDEKQDLALKSEILLEKIQKSEWHKQIINLACWLAVMRAYCHINEFTREIDEPEPETPTRLSQQFYKVALGLLLLHKKDDFGLEEWEKLKRLAEDTCLPVRLKILKWFMNNGFPTVDAPTLSTSLGYTDSNIRNRLNEMFQLGILDRVSSHDEDDYHIPDSWKVRASFKDLLKPIYPEFFTVELKVSSNAV